MTGGSDPHSGDPVVNDPLDHDAATGALGDTAGMAGAGGRDLAPGVAIGRYRLERVLGEGGFGVVYEATQSEPITRRVALKVIKRGMDSDAIVGRFEAERQALAVMDHPSIAKVFDGGTIDDVAAGGGRPYFVMELVEGEPITAFCDRFRLSLELRIELMARVCDAVQHAHNKGVVHRDLKASNILCTLDDDRKPQPKVIDFGIAKALDQQLSASAVVTMQGQMIGTPEYMSPEQAGGDGVDVDTRTDVYALGVVLHELLTGTRPLDLRDTPAGEVPRTIRKEAPVRPSRRIAAGGDDRYPGGLADITARRRTDPRMLATVLRRDLDWVILRCLEKDRDLRYDTPSALADELRRYLAGDPVEAGPPRPGYRAAKFIRRHRGAVTGVGMVVAALALSTTLALVSASRANRARGEATRALADRDEALAAESEQREEAVRQAEINGQVLRFFIDDVILAARPSAEEGAGFDVTVVEAVEKAAGRLDASVIEDIVVRARIDRAIADVFIALSRFDEAVVHAERAVDALREVEEPWSDELLTAASFHVEALRNHGSYDEAVKIAVAAEQAAAGRAAPDRMAAVLRGKSIALDMLGRFDEALVVNERCIELQRASGAPDAEEQVQGMLNNRAVILKKVGRLDEAATAYEEVLRYRELTLGPQDVLTIMTISNIASLRLSQERYAEAAELLEDASARAEGVLPIESFERMLLTINRGLAEVGMAPSEKGLDLIREAVAIADAIFPPGSFWPGQSRLVLADALRLSERNDEAIVTIDAALEHLRSSGPAGAVEAAEHMRGALIEAGAGGGGEGS